MQTIGLEHLEVIMINDGSKDRSGEIIEEYSSKYENFIGLKLPENSGTPGKPRNMGIEKSSADYLMFLDSDDYLTEDACEVLYNKIKEEGTDIVFSRYIQVYDIEKNKIYSSSGDIEGININKIDEDPRPLTISPSIWSTIYKRSFITKNNLSFICCINSEDLVFSVQAFFKANGIIYLDKHYSYYHRINDSEESDLLCFNKTKKSLEGMIKGYIETFDILKQNKKEEFFPLIFNENLQSWLENFIVCKISYADKKELLEEIGFLFEKYEKYELEPSKKYLIPLFKNISHKEYHNAIFLADIFENFIVKQKILLTNNKTLQKIYETVQDQLNETRIYQETLHKNNKNLEKYNKNLSQQNENLKINIQNLTQQNQTIKTHNKSLTQQNQKLEQN